MSRVNIDVKAYFDSRFAVLADRMGWADADHALGKMGRVWMECTLRETDTLTKAELGFALSADGSTSADALVEVRLADEIDATSVRIRGCLGRTDWLKKKRAAGKKGGRPPGKSSDSKDNPEKAETDSAFAGEKADIDSASPKRKPSGSGSGSDKEDGRSSRPFSNWVLDAFRAGAGQAFVDGPVAKGTSIALNTIAKKCREQDPPVTADDVEAAGRLVLSQEWRSEPMTAEDLAKAGTLWALIKKARGKKAKTSAPRKVLYDGRDSAGGHS